MDDEHPIDDAAADPAEESGSPPDIGPGEEVSSGPPSIAIRTSWSRRALLLVAALVVGLAAVAAAVGFVLLRGSEDVIDPMVPTSTHLYVTAYLDPAASQKVNLLRLTSKLPAHKDSTKVNEQIERILDEAFRPLGLGSKDIKPWIGSQVALAVKAVGLQPSLAFLVGTRDEGAARAALEKTRKASQAQGESWTQRSRAGATVFVGTIGGQPDAAYTVVNHVAVVSNDPAYVNEIVDTAAGQKPALSSTENFIASTKSLATARLAFAYADFKTLVPELEEASAAAAGFNAQSPTGFGALETFTGLGATLTAQSNGLSLDMTMTLDPSQLTPEQRSNLSPSPGQNPLLSFAPQRAFAILAAGGIKATLATSLGQFETSGPPGLIAFDRQHHLGDAIDHLTGSLVVEAEPGGGVTVPGAAAVIGINDQAAIEDFLAGVTASLAEPDVHLDGGAPPPIETYRGVEIHRVQFAVSGGLSIVPVYAVTKDVAIVASSPDEVKAVLDTKASGSDITDAPVFRQAVGSASSLGQLMFVDVQAIAAVIRTTLPPQQQSQFDSQVAPNLRPVKALVITGRTQGTRQTVRILLLVP
jgi:hypothetical protein